MVLLQRLTQTIANYTSLSCPIAMHNTFYFLLLAFFFPSPVGFQIKSVQWINAAWTLCKGNWRPHSLLNQTLQNGGWGYRVPRRPRAARLFVRFPVNGSPLKLLFVICSSSKWHTVVKAYKTCFMLSCLHMFWQWSGTDVRYMLLSFIVRGH